jgi:hypothetical protein
LIAGACVWCDTVLVLHVYREKEVLIMLKKTLVAAATTLALAGVTATGASAAYDLTGGDYASTSFNQHTFAFDQGNYTVPCDVSFAGNTDNVPGDAASTMLTPTFSNCDFFGFPVTATTTDPWKLTVTYADILSPYGASATGSLSLPEGAEASFEIPLLGCAWTITPSQTIEHGAGGNSLTMTNNWAEGDTQANVAAAGLSYTTNGFCPFGSGDNLSYQSNGPIVFPGVDIVSE